MASPKGSREADVPPVLPSIPLSPERPTPPSEQSIGELVRDVTTQLSTLVRAEIELARAEVTAEVRKGLTGGGYFLVALTIALFSLFFLFFTLAELLAVWLPRPAAFAIVFGVMLLAAAWFGLLGFRKVRRIRKPERTIATLRESAQTLSSRARASEHTENGHRLTPTS